MNGSIGLARDEFPGVVKPDDAVAWLDGGRIQLELRRWPDKERRVKQEDPAESLAEWKLLILSGF